MRILSMVALSFLVLFCFVSCRRTSTIKKPFPKEESTLKKESRFPDGIEPKQTSDDPTYGYTRDNPIKVGGPKGFSGPASEHLYLRHLRDSKFRPLSFKRLGSYAPGPDGHILDGYQLTDPDGNTYILYIDMYHKDIHPFNVKAPQGMYFWK